MVFQTKWLIICLLFTSTLCCCSFSSENASKSDAQGVQDFFKKAKSKENELGIFRGVSLVARGSEKNQPFYTKIQFDFENGKSVSLPAFQEYNGLVDATKSPLYNNISEYISLRKDSITREDVVKHCKSITDLGLQLNTYNLQSTPRLGDFVIFKLPSGDQVIYLFENGTISDDRWKKIVEESEKLDENWYWRKGN